MIWIIFQVVSLLQLIEIYYFHCSYVSRRLLTLSVFRTLSALSTFPDRISSFRMQIVFVSSDVKSKQLSEKIIPRCEGKHLIVVFNKADLIEDKQKENVLAKQ